MNSKLYITLKKVGYKPEQFRPLFLETEKAYNKLLNTLKKHQLKEPETLQTYCKTAFNQISAEESRIIEILNHLDTTKETESSYFDSERLFLTEILNYAGSAKAEIVEYLAVYQPDIFKGSKKELIKQYLRPYNLIRKQYEASNSDQQPTEAKPEPIEQNENSNLYAEIDETFKTFFSDWSKVFKKETDYKHLLSSLTIYFEGGNPKLKKIASKPRVKTKLGMFFREVFNSNANSGQSKKGNKEFEALIRQIDCFENLSEYDLNKCITRSY